MAETQLRGRWLLGDGHGGAVDLDWDDTETEHVAEVARTAEHHFDQAGSTPTGRVRIEIAGEKKAEVQFDRGLVDHLHRFIGGRMRKVRYYLVVNHRGKPDLTAMRPTDGEAA